MMSRLDMSLWKKKKKKTGAACELTVSQVRRWRFSAASSLVMASCISMSISHMRELTWLACPAGEYS